MDSSQRKDFYLTVAILVEKEGNKAFACFLLSVGVDSHEPVCLPVLGPDAEHPRLQLLPILHIGLSCEVGNAPSMVVPKWNLSMFSRFLLESYFVSGSLSVKDQEVDTIGGFFTPGAAGA